VPFFSLGINSELPTGNENEACTSGRGDEDRTGLNGGIWEQVGVLPLMSPLGKIMINL